MALFDQIEGHDVGLELRLVGSDDSEPAVKKLLRNCATLTNSVPLVCDLLEIIAIFEERNIQCIGACA